MQSIENVNNNQHDLLNREVTVPDKESYDLVRFNAMKHGILSKLVVLPHEDQSEYSDLLDALKAEHRPEGMTELHLIEELTAIMWRKRRVLLAENAAVNRGLRSTINNSHDNPIANAVPLELGLKKEGCDLQDLLTSSPEEIAERLREAEIDLAATQKAASILRKGGANAYEKARRALIPESRAWWDEYVEDEEYSANSDDLASFIRDSLEPVCYRMVKEAQFVREIRAQTYGEGLQAHRLEKLNRYETHLDRKFERTLAMLLKLKELRNRTNTNRAE
ncbi:hypothetical protein [Methylomonas sp. MgM2]